jgi:hypothetical protein
MRKLTDVLAFLAGQNLHALLFNSQLALDQKTDRISLVPIFK